MTTAAVSGSGDQRLSANATSAARQPGDLRWSLHGDRLTIEASSEWTFDHVARLDRREDSLLDDARRVGKGSAHIDLDGITTMDTSGAWLVHRLAGRLDGLGWSVDIPINDRRHRALLIEVRRAVFDAPSEPVPPGGLTRMVAALGKGTIDAFLEGARLLSFFGWTMGTLVRTLLRPSRLRLTSLTHHLEQTCLNALPIVGLIAFLIGVVMAYQGADQLKTLRR